MRAPSFLSAAAVFLALLPVIHPDPGLGAQDVEKLGEYHGTRPPAGYFDELERNPEAFRFEMEGRERLMHVQSLRGMRFDDAVRRQGSPALSMGPRDEPVVGEFRFPLILGLFANGPAEGAYDRDRIQQEYFDGPNSRHQTVAELYAEMSGGRVDLQGTAFPWVQVELTREQVTRNQSGLVSHRTGGVGNFIVQIVEALDEAGVDWSEFDNTGDGFVDVLTVVQPDYGAECDGSFNRIWSHRWTIRDATRGEFDPGYPTNTPRPDGSGHIYVNDYTIQPALACDGQGINEVGVFAHELGHGFGLPDLYGTQWAVHPGSGQWDLMGTGSWGCQGRDPSRPCSMGAWSRAMLGWVDVTEVDPDTDHGAIVLPPVESSGEVLRVSAQNGSREYLLLENRQRIGTDQDLWEPGLLIWHIDPDELDWRWGSNIVNRNQHHMAVWLRQADGKNELSLNIGNHGDRGDPFPGCVQDHDGGRIDSDAPCVSSTHAFHAGSDPAAWSHVGEPLGVTLTDIELVGNEPYDVRFDLSTRFTRIALGLETEGEATAAPDDPFRIDGSAVSGHPATVLSAPFHERELEAPPGAALGEGVRVGFQGWSDGAPRVRGLVTPSRDTVLTAAYGGEEVRLTWIATSPRDDLTPGSLQTLPGSHDLWFSRGTSVEVEARARTGFTFRHWVGELGGASNPTQIEMDRPRTLEAEFSFDFGFTDPPDTLRLEAAQPVAVRIEVANGADPIRWNLVEGSLPPGMSFNISDGRLNGAPLEMGTFTVRIRAVDDGGLDVETELTLDVGPPAVGIERLAGSFLGGQATLSGIQRQFLDRFGNGNQRYDVGDLRAFVRAFPEVLEHPSGAAERGDPPRTITLRFPEREQDGSGQRP